ncbi:long-chain-fatty-acid--CoA ligase [Rhodococcus pseudokoreensis]|uniref:Long-chain-fatty-acid--CoA ligase n=1 Tax=Rhodococcus pseudokoreensis TaxID=2811421 RepID=A0A974ZTK3_9NOCA|nr:long-chain fatty acid--CoA ligase [Rhodococcus pseudokoreensis]QSE89856.1 long-chain-fatty-acid--CoA ligase [Rhodococcus pseudokoreensis]
MYFTQGLHRSVQQNPDRAAVIDGDREVTFRELRARVARLAGGLQSLGARPGDRVGILATNRVEYIEYILACAWLGVISSPVNNRWSLDEMAFQIEDAGIGILVVDKPRLETAKELRTRRAELHTLVCIDGDDTDGSAVDYERMIADAEPIEDSFVDPDELALLMYTGGTTGRSKGVMLTSGQVMVSAMGATITASLDNQAQRVLHVAPFFHLAAYCGALQHIMIGSTHVLIGDFTVEALAEVISTRRVTMTTLVPTMLQWLLDYAAEHGTDLSSLQCMSYGTAPMPEPLVRKLIDEIPGIRLRQVYGMTELAPAATILTNADHYDRDHPERLRSVGRAAAHAEVRIVDPGDVEVPRGTVGEVVVRGKHMMLGYLNLPEESARALRGGWMHTGDAGYMDDHGYLFLVDRLKDMIVSGGENVYSAEVEKVVHTHPAVASCAVIGVPDEVWGERVHCVVVLEPRHTLTAEDLRDFVGERIARYKAPRTVSIVDAMPLSPVGKILKRKLRDEYVS